VRLWSDYLRARYHPRTNAILQEYQHGNALAPFDTYGLGCESYREQCGEDVEDRVRFFAEEADTVQGFHVLTDGFNAFGGVTSALLEHLSDEYASKCRLVLPVTPARFAEHSVAANSSRFLNSVLSLSESAGFSSLVAPLSLAADTFVLPGRHRRLPHLDYDPELAYHTSAVLASALDTLTLAWRDKRSPVQMAEVAAGLASNGRKVAAAAVALPFGLGEGEHLVDFLKDERIELVSLTPSCSEVNTGVFMQAVTLRGIPSDLLRPADFRLSQRYSGHPYLRCETVQEALALSLSRSFPSVVSGAVTSKATLPTGAPFPHVFKREVSVAGQISSSQQRKEGKGVERVAALAAWQSSKGAGEHCSSLEKRAAKVNLNKFHRFMEAGLEEDDYKECLETLAELADCYTESDIMD